MYKVFATGILSILFLSDDASSQLYGAIFFFLKHLTKRENNMSWFVSFCFYKKFTEDGAGRGRRGTEFENGGKPQFDRTSLRKIPADRPHSFGLISFKNMWGFFFHPFFLLFWCWKVKAIIINTIFKVKVRGLELQGPLRLTLCCYRMELCAGAAFESHCPFTSALLLCVPLFSFFLNIYVPFFSFFLNLYVPSDTIQIIASFWLSGSTTISEVWGWAV